MQWALHAADLTAPLQIYLDSQPAKFDVNGAWEVIEHIEERDIAAVLENIKLHLSDKKVSSEQYCYLKRFS